jgi:hypothetical protein
MVTKKITIETERDFCDFCDAEEHYPKFHKCVICGRLLCPECETRIIPLTYNEFSVCKECNSPEIEKIKIIREKANELYKQIDELCKEETIIETRFRDARINKRTDHA